MKLKELLDALNQNTLVTITTCGKHGGCIVMDTPAYMAYNAVGEAIHSRIDTMKVFRNTLEIRIEVTERGSGGLD